MNQNKESVKMVSIPNTHEADKSVKFGIKSVHTQKLPSKNKMEATNQQTGLPIFSNNYHTDKLTESLFWGVLIRLEWVIK